MPELENYLPKTFLELQGQTLPEVLTNLHKARDEFITKLEGLPEDLLHTRNNPEKWSAGEITDHINVSNGFFAKCLERCINQKQPLVMPKGHVSNDGRAQNPASEPRTDQTHTGLMLEFQAAINALEQHAQTCETQHLMSEICVIQSFFGALNCLEVLQLCAWHTAHHAKQILTPNLRG